MFPTIDDQTLEMISGGGNAAYNFGYTAGDVVTRLYEKLPSGAKLVPDPSNSSQLIPKADIPVIGPALTRWGFTNVGAGATDVVNDRARQHAVPR